MANFSFPVYEFRPLNEEGRQLLRYNNGNWIADDGEWDVCFITNDNMGAPMCYYVSLPYRKNLMWSWAKNGNWGAHVARHPGGNAWHYQSKDGSSDISDGWERDKHPNEKAGRAGMERLSSKNGCANGRGVEFHIGDPYIIAGLLRERESKKVIRFPKKFKCIYCGEHDLDKVKMEEQNT